MRSSPRSRGTDWVVGGTYTATDERGDACKFTRGLAALAAARGTSSRCGVRVDALEVAGGAVSGVSVRTEGARSETLAAGSGMAIAEIVSGCTPDIGFRFLGT